MDVVGREKRRNLNRLRSRGKTTTEAQGAPQESGAALNQAVSLAADSNETWQWVSCDECMKWRRLVPPPAPSEYEHFNAHTAEWDLGWLEEGSEDGLVGDFLN